MDESDYLTNHILIAMPALADPNFFQSVTYICQHTEEGAMGIIINRPADISLREILAHLDVGTEDTRMDHIPVYVGGPVQRERGFVIHSPVGDWDSSFQVSEEIAVTSSRDVLEAIALGNGPERHFVALGYAGWTPGQLEQEIAENAWLYGPLDPAIIFDVPDDERWPAAAASIGVDLTLLSVNPGHG